MFASFYDFIKIKFRKDLIENIKNDETLEKINPNLLFNIKNILDEFIRIQSVTKVNNQKTSIDFNILRLFNIGETMHSFLLANILNPNSEHGQGKLFLVSFLTKIGIECPDKGQWTVTAEKGRIDILLKRKNPHSVVIIENKSNLAVDQNHQLYRYWFQEIHYPNRFKYINYADESQNNYRIIYLTPVDWKQPSSKTLLKPNHWPQDLPDSLPLTPTIWKFNKEIVEWIESMLSEIDSDNHRLKEYLKQYIEIWK